MKYHENVHPTNIKISCANSWEQQIIDRAKRIRKATMKKRDRGYQYKLEWFLWHSYRIFFLESYHVFLLSEMHTSWCWTHFWHETVNWSTVITHWFVTAWIFSFGNQRDCSFDVQIFRSVTEHALPCHEALHPMPYHGGRTDQILNEDWMQCEKYPASIHLSSQITMRPKTLQDLTPFLCHKMAYFATMGMKACCWLLKA